MIFNFKTARNANGHRDYLYIDTSAKTFRTEYHLVSELMGAVEIKKKDYRRMVENLRGEEGWTEGNTLISFR